MTNKPKGIILDRETAEVLDLSGQAAQLAALAKAAELAEELFPPAVKDRLSMRDDDIEIKEPR